MALIYNATFDSQTRILSLLDKAGNVISSCEVPSKSKELTLTATADNSSVKLTKKGTLSNTYEVNTGDGWTAYAFGTDILLNAGESCKWRCSAHPTTQSDSNYVQFVMTGKIEASGYITSMLTSGFRSMSSLSGYDYAFSHLFSGCTALTKAHALRCCETLSPKCFNYTFSGCSSLTLDALFTVSKTVVLAESCCLGMYYNCSGLEIGYARGRTLKDNCFKLMFAGCTSLSTVITNATTMGSATGAFTDWLSGVTTKISFDRVVFAYASLGLPTNSFSGIPTNWRRKDATT